jgi:glycerol-3-phosphate dehydrogenase
MLNEDGGLMTGNLGPRSRKDALEALSGRPLDLLVVGAGATGCGTALDAAARGLKVALIDKGDIAGGTSSRSSQLVHGGLRYLQQGNVALVRESLRERGLLLSKLAPHLVEPLPFMFPLHHRIWERVYIGAGLLAYDLLGGSGTMPKHSHVSKRTALARFPGLRPDALVGALQYYDAQMDDARLAVAIARTAADQGAHVAPHVSLVRAGDEAPDGLHRVVVRDELTQAEYTVAARCIALCVGVWAPDVSDLFTASGSTMGIIRSKGVHLRLPRSAIDGQTALIIPTGKSVLFVLPSRTHWLIGTTDTEWLGDPDSPEPTDQDIDYLLGLLAGVVSPTITRADVTYAFAGLRPLVRDQAVGGNTAKVTREHRIARVAPGVLAIVGGKWTTYRVMARDLVDTVLKESGSVPRACTSDAIPLVGSFVEAAAPAVSVDVLTAADRAVLGGRYGSRANEVLALMVADPRLAEPLPDAPGYWAAEVVHACQSEGACLLGDVVDRRLRFGLNLDAVTPGLIRATAEIMGEAMGWDQGVIDSAAGAYAVASAHSS